MVDLKSLSLEVNAWIEDAYVLAGAGRIDAALARFRQVRDAESTFELTAAVDDTVIRTATSARAEGGKFRAFMLAAAPPQHQACVTLIGDDTAMPLRGVLSSDTSAM